MVAGNLLGIGALVPARKSLPFQRSRTLLPPVKVVPNEMDLFFEETHNPSGAAAWSSGVCGTPNSKDPWGSAAAAVWPVIDELCQLDNQFRAGGTTAGMSPGDLIESIYQSFLSNAPGAAVQPEVALWAKL
jgi:hypothetical protein